MSFIANRKLYLTADRKRVVDVVSAEAGYLFRAAGHRLTQEEAERYGLIGTDLIRPINPPPTAVVKEEAETPSNKAVTVPPATKAVKSPKRK